MSRLSYDRAIAGDPSAPALIGVSGGRDSVALLHALWADGFRQLVVCHFDHGWRPEKSAAEAEFVRALASRYELAFEHETDPAPVMREAAGRAARFGFFARVAMRRGVARVLLAHHADDQVETFLFNLLRGAAGRGLGGMQAVRRRSVEGVELEMVRPMLGCWRAEIDAYIAAHGLEYREDDSNTDARHARNRLRHDALPNLREAAGRRIDLALWRAAAVIAGENDYFETLPEVREIPEELVVQTMRGLHVAVQRRVIHEWLRKHRIESIGFEEVEQVRALLEHAVPAKVNLPGNCHARRRAGKIFITPEESAERRDADTHVPPGL